MIVLLALAVATGHPQMQAVEGGAHKVGSKWTEREVELDAFFIDKARVSRADYLACVETGACPAGMAEGELAAVDWERAARFCAQKGKRLPTAPELEISGLTAKELEWSSTWFVRPSACRKKRVKLEKASDGAWAEAFCGQRDRLNACDGAVFCGNLYRRVAKDLAEPKARKGINAYKDKRQLPFRCALSRSMAERKEVKAPGARALPSPPTDEQLALFRKIKPDTVPVPECEKPGRSFSDCRDPRSYLKSNEPLLDVVLPHIENLGGGYVGVGSDQNYTFLAAAKPEWVWLFDYDKNVVYWHHVLRALILEAKTRQEFVAMFDKANVVRAVAAINKHALKGQKKRTMRGLFKGARGPLKAHYIRQRDKRAWSWLGNDEDYAYVRGLYLQGRIIAFEGNLLEKNGMRTVADAARALKVPVRVYYPSNAPEFWPFTAQYRKNVRGLPFDDQSVVVQTISGLSLKTGFGQKGYWHYNIQHGLSQQARLLNEGITRHKQMLYHRKMSDSPELTLTDMVVSAR